MQISCMRDDLQIGVNTVSKAVSTRTTMPILQCILIQAKNGQVIMTANDMDLGIESTVIGEIFEEGMIAVPEPETNEFRTSKFIILTAANYQEMSWGYEGTGAKNYLTEYCEDAIGTSGSIPADTQYGNGDGRLTMSELLSYLNNTLALRRFDDYDDKGNLLGSYYQHPQIYPSNSSYVLFIR